MNELLPCPFCGGEAVMFEDDYGDWHVYCGDGWYVERNLCPGYHAIDCMYITKAQAIEAWNTRAERTCRNVDDHKTVWFICSECDELKKLAHLGNCCPNCGAKVVS